MLQKNDIKLIFCISRESLKILSQEVARYGASRVLAYKNATSKRKGKAERVNNTSTLVTCARPHLEEREYLGLKFIQCDVLESVRDRCVTLESATCERCSSAQCFNRGS